MSDEQWQTMIDINLTGVWHTMKAAVPQMLSEVSCGSIIAISSVGGIKALPSQAEGCDQGVGWEGCRRNGRRRRR
jgi:NADP-dependent 3-hydroxy acid dehydrogenase YdfG